MKRSFLALASLFFSVSLLATSYSGKGKWESTNGDRGEYDVTANIEEEDDLVTISQTLNFGDRVLDFSVTVVKRTETFYDILRTEDGEYLGSGYCFKLDAEQGKICHSESAVGYDYLESTIKITPERICRMGSKLDGQTGEQIVWSDSLLPTAEGNATATVVVDPMM